MSIDPSIFHEVGHGAAARAAAAAVRPFSRLLRTSGATERVAFQTIGEIRETTDVASRLFPFC